MSSQLALGLCLGLGLGLGLPLLFAFLYCVLRRAPRHTVTSGVAVAPDVEHQSVTGRASPAPSSLSQASSTEEAYASPAPSSLSQAVSADASSASQYPVGPAALYRQTAEFGHPRFLSHEPETHDASLDATVNEWTVTMPSGPPRDVPPSLAAQILYAWLKCIEADEHSIPDRLIDPEGLHHDLR